MHKDTLPTKIDPFRFAENAHGLQGVLQIKGMARLCESLSATDGTVDVDILFGIDEQGIKFAKGHLSTRLKLQCQRCLEPFEYEIIGSFMSGIVHTDEEADQLPERYDPLIVKDNSLVISDMIEEELLVSLPIVPMHDLGACKVKLPFASGVEVTTDAEKENPFKVIEKLRTKRD